MQYLQIAVAFVIILSYAFAQEPKQVKVSVYYESLCPDSINFLSNQFFPTYNELSEYITVDLVPYGKAVQKKINGKWVFLCQHGLRECFGNKVQACVLNDNTISDEKKLDFVNCVMDSWIPPNAGSKCAETVGVDYQAIEMCANSEEGSNFLAHYGDITHGVTPKIKFVPTIIYDDVYDKNKQDGSLHGFKYILCNELGNIPAACNPGFRKNNNHHNIPSILIIPLFLIFAIIVT